LSSNAPPSAEGAAADQVQAANMKYMQLYIGVNRYDKCTKMGFKKQQAL